MTQRFYVMRHGASEANLVGKVQGIQDVPLAARGEHEAHTAGLALQGLGIQRIFASPMQRAYRTAELVAEQLGLSVEILEGLTARNLGEWAARSRADIKAMWSDLSHPFRSDPHFAPPGGESLYETEQRLWKAVDPILSSKDIVPLFVSHLVATGALVNRVSGQRPPFHNAEVWVLHPTERTAEMIFRPEGDLLEGAE
ncbi:MAG: histidine phosphatase family protein [Myxococcales bacterium]|nr:histidine phosphatase family protein [Myxococcales bacterium]